MNKSVVSPIQNLITDNLKYLLQTNGFIDQLKFQKLEDDDCVLINNSFILRKPLIKTKKNSLFLMVRIKNQEPDFSNIYVAKPSDFDGDFKFLSAKQAASAKPIILEDAIIDEIKNLGKLIFFLIGEIIETPFSVEIQNHFFHELRFDPIAKMSGLEINGDKKTIVVNKLIDPSLNWNILEPQLALIPDLNLDSMAQAFARSFEILQNNARLNLVLPDSISPKKSNTFIDQLHNSVVDQRRLYEIALHNCIEGTDENNINLRELMRISYNFADDAIKLLQLFVSLSDLKGVILWSTIKAHFDITESIRNLPWTKNDKKASPDYYVTKIKGARNHAFHNLLLFDRTIEADLTGIQVNARKLTILPAHNQRKNIIPLDYEDREIVEILSEITRATETVVTLEFWKKNLAVIKSFEVLLKSTEEALWLLSNSTSAHS